MAENTVIEASRIYTFLADDMTEAAFYKTLERFCQSGSLVHLTKGLYYKPKKSRFGIVPIREQDIVTHYIGNQKGLVVGYKLYNEKGLTTQISKQTEVFSNHVPGQRKTIQNVVVKNISWAYSPVGKDKLYPCEAVRASIEKYADENMISEYKIAMFNQRGVFSFSAGREEKVIAERYKNTADHFKIKYPKTAEHLYK